MHKGAGQVKSNDKAIVLMIANYELQNKDLKAGNSYRIDKVIADFLVFNKLAKYS